VLGGGGTSNCQKCEILPVKNKPIRAIFYYVKFESEPIFKRKIAR